MSRLSALLAAVNESDPGETLESSGPDPRAAGSTPADQATTAGTDAPPANVPAAPTTLEADDEELAQLQTRVETARAEKRAKLEAELAALDAPTS